MTVNRPEFRELSPSTYEDFDMYSLVMGNPNLKKHVVSGLDLLSERDLQLIQSIIAHLIQRG